VPDFLSPEVKDYDHDNNDTGQKCHLPEGLAISLQCNPGVCVERQQESKGG
jgi:hypothetical protein